MSKANVGERGPSWADVGELIGHLEAEHRCRIVVETALIPKSRGALSVDVHARRVRGRNDWYNVKYVIGRWPSHAASTMPGLLVGMLWRLDNDLSEYDASPVLAAIVEQEECPPPPA